MPDRESRNQLLGTVTDAVTSALLTQAARDGFGYWNIDDGVLDTHEFSATDLAAHITAAVTAAAFETVRIAAAHPDHEGQLRTVIEFREAATAITTHATGSRTYLAGTVTAQGWREGRGTGDAEAVEAFVRLDEPTLWVEVATTTGLGYVRVQEWSTYQGALTIVCSQAASIGFARIDDRNHTLTLVEPEQPAPFQKWADRERAHAIRDLCAHWPQRPATILVGPQLVPFDPWAPEFLAGAA